MPDLACGLLHGHQFTLVYRYARQILQKSVWSLTIRTTAAPEAICRPPPPLCTIALTVDHVDPLVSRMPPSSNAPAVPTNQPSPAFPPHHRSGGSMPQCDAKPDLRDCINLAGLGTNPLIDCLENVTDNISQSLGLSGESLETNPNSIKYLIVYHSASTASTMMIPNGHQILLVLEKNECISASSRGNYMIPNIKIFFSLKKNLLTFLFL